MPNIKISALPPATLPLDDPNTLFEVTVIEAGQEVSRRISLDEIAGATGLDATFLTLSTNAQLPNERVLTEGTGISFVDTGPGGTLTINSSGVTFPLIAPSGSAAAPSYAFTDGDSGFFEPLDDNIQISLVGTARFFWELDTYNAVAGTGPAMVNIAASSTDPGFLPRRSDPDTGVGSAASDQLSLIAGGVEIARAIEAVAANQFAVAQSGSSSVPDLTSLADLDTGFRFPANNETVWIGGGSRSWNFSTAKFYSQFSNGPALMNEISSATNPTVVPDHSDSDTGLGHTPSSDQLSLIAGGVEGIRVTEAAAAITVDIFGALNVSGLATFNGLAQFNDVATFSGDVQIRDGSDFEIFDGTNTFRALLTTLLAPDRFRISGAGDLEFFDVDSFNTSMRLFGGISLDVTETGVVPGTPAAGSGQFWVRNDVPNVPIFTDDNGVDWVLNAAAVSPDPLLLSSGGVGVPSYSFSTDSDTGMWNPGADILGFSAGGVEGLRLTELNSGVIPAPDATQGITAFATGGQVSATQLDSGYNVITTVATTGDSVKLPPVFAVNSVIYITNDGANNADVFPATGDDLGAGVDTAVSLVAGSTISFIATVADSTWTQLTLSAGSLAIPDPLLLSAGSAVAPTYSFSGDPDTGVYNTSADVLGLTAGGVQVAQVVEVGGAGQLIVSPGAFLGSAAAPSLAIGDGDTGFYETFDDVLFLSIGGVNRFVWADAANSLQGAVIGAGSLRNEVSSTTNPTLGPRNDDADTGIGSGTADTVSIIGGGVELLRAIEAGTSATDQVFLPRDGDEATPALALGALDRGFYAAGVAQINATIGGSRVQFFNSSAFTQFGSIGVGLATGPRMLEETPSATNPTVLPRQSDVDSGLGSRTLDTVNLVAGSVRAVEYEEASNHIIQYNENHVGLTASVTQTQAGGLALLSSYNEIGTVANPGDALTAFLVSAGARLIVINNGANQLQLFPGVGDDFGAGVDVAIEIDAGSVGVFIGRTGVTWDVLFNSNPNVEFPGGATVSGTWQFDSSTVEADPGSGTFRNNNATIASVTEVFINSITEQNVDADNILGLLGNGDQIYIQNLEDATEFMLFDITANVDNTGWYSLAGTVAASNANFTNGEKFGILLLFGGTGAPAVPVANDAAQARRTTVYALTTAFVDITMDVTDIETDSAVIDHDLATNTDNIIFGVAGTYEVTYDFDVICTAVTGDPIIDMGCRVRLNDAGTGINGSLADPYVFRDGSVGGDNGQFQVHVSNTFIVTVAATDFITLQLDKTELSGTATFNVSKICVKARRLL